MAIIYTYPKLQDPQGNELIVVSDVNNKNATRLITIADIASLVPGGAGCGASIVNITDSEGTPIYTPLACSPMILTSSDASIGITGITGGIDLTNDCTWTLQKAPQPSDPDPPQYSIGCDSVIFLEDTCSIAPTITPAGTTQRVTFDLNYGPYGDEGGSDFIGCATIDNNVQCSDEIIYRQFIGGTYEVHRTAISNLANCFTTTITCADTENIGGIKIGAVDELAVPVTGTGTPTWVEVNSNCEAIGRS